MNDPIERDDVIKAIDKRICELQSHPTFKHKNADIDLYGAKKLIMSLPSARPKGEWIAVSAFDAFGGDENTWLAHGNPIAFHYCSECKEQTRMDEFGEEILSNYCPNCGADMRGINNVKD